MKRVGSSSCQRSVRISAAATALLVFLGVVRHGAVHGDSTPPNIVFIILDDVGIDQLASFGLNFGDLAATPNLDTLANAGLKFTNVWAMPECSPSRACMFTGRYPLRTGVTSAIIPTMLPQAQLSPYEATLPRVLATAGYKSAMVGKYHLGSNNPSGNCAARTRGWDYFQGNMEAGPPSIDPQGGHVEDGADDEANALACGFDQGVEPGSCYFEDGSCSSVTVDVPTADGGTIAVPVTARSCLEAGGLFVSGVTGCEEGTIVIPCPGDETRDCVMVGDGEAILDFQRTNGYYVWPETIVSGSLPPGTTDFSDPGCGEPLLRRDYMTIAQTDAGIAWYEAQTGPRMLTVSYNAIHTPYQQPLESLTSGSTGTLDCGTLLGRRELGDSMLEAMDREIGRLLSSLNLASLDDQGTIQTVVDDAGNLQIPELQASNTMVVAVGDNGTFVPSVKFPPFDPLRSKGFVYQTGVWVPLIIAGPLVQGPTGRNVRALVNVVDLFELFGEIAGVEVGEVVPPAHTLDSQPMLAYLTDPDPRPIRQYNFTQLGTGVFETSPDPDERNWRCTLGGALGGTCLGVLFDTQDLCETNGGVWWGPSEDPSEKVVEVLGEDAAPLGLGSCCEVQRALADAEPPEEISINPLEQFAVRNDRYKLVQLSLPDCSVVDDSFPPANRTSVLEFYDLTPIPFVNPVGLDREVDNLLCSVRSGGPLARCKDGSLCDVDDPTECLSPYEKTNFKALLAELNRIIGSEPSCEGDGNLDLRVDERDLDGVISFSTAVSPLDGTVGGTSFFDFSRDGLTDDADAQIVIENFGTDCLDPCRRADLNRDGDVDVADLRLAIIAHGQCDLCGADLNGDGVVDFGDWVRIWRRFGCGSVPLVVHGTGDPSIDPVNVQAAIDTATRRGRHRTVRLVGSFNFEDCVSCVVVPGPITIRGASDPTVDDPDETIVTTIFGGVFPFVIDDRDHSSGRITIRDVWFRDGTLGAINILQLRGHLELRRNRITGIAGALLFHRLTGIPREALFRFAISAAAVDPGAGDLTGTFLAQHNYIDSRDDPFESGDDNGIALQGCHFSRIDIVDNRIFTRGESVEIEGCTNPDARITVARNKIISNGAISTLAIFTDAVGLDRLGGHPAALKVLGSAATRVVIQGNHVTTTGSPSGVCIETGTVNPGGTTKIVKNRCDMDGQFAAILGGWSGAPGFFPPSFLQNATVEKNTFTGNAFLGVALLDFDFIPDPDADLTNEAHDNLFKKNDFREFRSVRATYYLGPSTHDNVSKDRPFGEVEDLGTNNQIRE